MISVKGCGFDAASKVEIDSVSELVPSDRIIFAQTCKIAEHIEFARQKDVAMMTFDSISELQKIKRTYPNAKGKTHDFYVKFHVCSLQSLLKFSTLVILRTTADDSNSKAKLSKKFGAEPSLWEELVNECRRLELNLYGVAFHVGSQDSRSIPRRNSVSWFQSFTAPCAV